MYASVLCVPFILLSCSHMFQFALIAGMVMYASVLCVRAGSAYQASFEVVRQVSVFVCLFVCVYVHYIYMLSGSAYQASFEVVRQVRAVCVFWCVCICVYMCAVCLCVCCVCMCVCSRVFA